MASVSSKIYEFAKSRVDQIEKTVRFKKFEDKKEKIRVRKGGFKKGEAVDFKKLLGERYE